MAAASVERSSPSKRKREDEKESRQGFLVLIKDNDNEGSGRRCEERYALYLSADEYEQVLQKHAIGDVMDLHSTRYDHEAWQNFGGRETAVARALLADPQFKRYQERAVAELSVPVTHIIQLHTKSVIYDDDDDELGTFRKTDFRPELQFYVELHSAVNCTLVAGVLITEMEIMRALSTVKAKAQKRKRIQPWKMDLLNELNGTTLREKWSVRARRGAQHDFTVSDLFWAPELADAIMSLDNFDELKGRVAFMPADLSDDCYIALCLPR